MTGRETKILQGICSRIEYLTTWRQQNRNNRRAIAEHGYSMLRDANLVHEIGCRANVPNIYGRDGTRAEHAQLQRDLAKMEDANLVRIATDGRLRYVMPISDRAGVLPAGADL